VVVPQQQRLEEIIHGVKAKIPGDVADPQPAVGIGRVAQRPAAEQGGCDLAVENAGLLDHPLMRHVGIAEDHDQVVVRQDQIRDQRDRRPVIFDRLEVAALTFQIAGQIAHGIGVVGLDVEGLAIKALGPLEIAFLGDGIAEVVAGFHQKRIEAHGFGKMPDRLIDPVQFEIDGADVVVGLGGMGSEFNDLAVAFDRRVEVTLTLVQIAEVDPGVL
jgi:hypothetical protein